VGPRALAAAAILAALAATPAAADWLVTRAGSRIETRGPWEVKGKLVVFTLPDGSLSSLRVVDVDLAASRQQQGAKAPAAAPRRATPPARKRISVTDKDVRHAEPPAASAQDSAAKPDATGPGPDAKEAAGLAVASWERNTDGGHLVVHGRLRNDAKAAATDIALTAHLFDDAGTRIATAQGTLSSTVLMPGQEALFDVDFPDVVTFASLKFETRSAHLAVAPEPKAAQPAGQAQPPGQAQPSGQAQPLGQAQPPAQ